MLPTLISIQCWTPFYWEQNRLGSLLPLIARPLGDPFTNLLAQNAASAAAGFASLWLVASYFAGPCRGPIVGLLACCVAILVLPDRRVFELFVGHPEHFVAMAAGMAGLRALDSASAARWRLASGMLLLMLAGWVNLAIPIWLALLVSGRRLLAPRAAPGGQWVAALAAVAVCFAANSLLAGLSAAPPSDVRLLEPSAWPHAARQLLERWWQAYLAPRGLWAVLLAGGLAGALLGRHPAARAGFRAARASAAAQLLAAAGFALAMGVCEHVADNRFHPRYLVPVTALLVTGAMTFFAVPLAALVPAKRLVAGAAVVMLAGSFLRYGAPRPARVHELLLHRWGEQAEQVNTERCTHVMGRYWDVWPTVFTASMLRHREGDGASVHGLAYRAAGTRHLWSGMPRDRFRIAVFRHSDPNEIRRIRIAYGVPGLQSTAATGTSHFLIYGVEDAASQKPAQVLPGS